MTHAERTTESALSTWLILLMATTTGLVVASNYYAQPLLHTISDQLGLSYARAGIIVTVAQASYALGLILLVPLGDLVERRRLIVTMMLFATAGLLVSASAGSLAALLVGTAITGAFSVVAQVLVPFAATLSPVAQRGKVVGTVMSGLLMGILLARTVAGALSSLGDWHTVYWVAAALMLLNTLALWRALPRYAPTARMHYGQLIGSVFAQFARYPLHRQRSMLGCLIFAMFSVLWTSLAFLLSSEPWSYSDATIGLFGPGRRHGRALRPPRRRTDRPGPRRPAYGAGRGGAVGILGAAGAGRLFPDRPGRRHRAAGPGAAGGAHHQHEHDLQPGRGRPEPAEFRLHVPVLRRRRPGFAGLRRRLPALRLAGGVPAGWWAGCVGRGLWGLDSCRADP